MKKSDLKSGMVVVTRKGEKGIVLLGTSKGDIIGGCGDSTNGMWYMLDDGIYENLTSKLVGQDSADIVKVYDGGSNMTFGTTNLESLRLIWERPADPVVLTIDEIAKRFGIDPSLIQIKKD